MAKKNRNKSRYWMTPLYQHPTPGLYYVRFYGPEVHSQTWGWYQASALVRNYQDAIKRFRTWAARTQEYINAQT